MRSRSTPGSVHGRRGRSPPKRRSGGDRGRKENGSVSILVRNIPPNCCNQPLRVAFERFGPVQDVYIPRLYYSRQPRGFAFVEFADASDATEALLHMNNSMFHGHKITVIVAAESRKRPEEMCRRASARSNPDHKRHSTSRYGRSCSRTRSPSPRYSLRARSRSPARRDGEGSDARRRSPNPASGSHSRRRHGTPDNSASSKRKEEPRQTESWKRSKENEKPVKRIPDGRKTNRDAGYGSKERHGRPDNSTSKRKEEPRQAESWKRSKEDENSVKRIPDDRKTSRDAGHGSKEKPVTGAHKDPPPPEVTSRANHQLSDGSWTAKYKRPRVAVGEGAGENVVLVSRVA